MLVRDHEAVETKPKAEEQEKIDIRPRGPSDRLGAQQEPGDHAKMRREDELALREQQLQETRRTEGEKKSQVEQRRKPMVSEVGLPREPSTTPSFVLAREGAPGAVSTAPVTALGALGRAGGKQAAKGSVNVSGDGGEGWGRQTLKLKALAARLRAHYEGIRQGVLDPNTSREQPRVQFEDLFSLRDEFVLEALEARYGGALQGLLQGILDQNISEQQLRVKFEDLLSVKGQLDAQHL